MAHARRTTIAPAARCEKRSLGMSVEGKGLRPQGLPLWPTRYHKPGMKVMQWSRELEGS